MFVPLKPWMWIAVLIVISGSWAYYNQYSEVPMPMSENDRIRTDLAKRWAQTVSAELTNMPGRPTVAVACVVDDENGILTQQLKSWIERRNVQLVNNGWIDYSAAAICQWANPECVADATKPYVGYADYIISAQISNWTTYPEFEACLNGTVRIYDGKSGKLLEEYELSQPETTQVKGKPAPSQDQPSGQSLVTRHLVDPTGSETMQAAQGGTPQTKIARLKNLLPLAGGLVWVAGVGALPTFFSASLSRLLRNRCNQTNGLLLVSWAIGVTAAAFLTWVLFLPCLIGLPLMVIAVLLATLYFGYYCELLSAVS